MIAISRETLQACWIALENRSAEVEADLVQARRQRYVHKGAPVAEAIEELEGELGILGEAIEELGLALRTSPCPSCGGEHDEHPDDCPACG